MGTRVKRILVIEDHDDSRRVTATILRRSGYVVSGAATKAEALKLCDENQFDILLSDIDLPDGSGIELMRELGSRCKIIGIAISGYGDQSHLSEARAAGFSAHLLKPVTIDTLLDAIRKVSPAPLD